MAYHQAKIAYGLLSAIALAGIGCWVYQLYGGLSVTGMNNSVSWGAYIAMFMFFVGLSAGGLIVASSAHVFGIESFKRVAKPAVICSTVCICCAGLFILIDLGGIQRVWRMLLGPNPSSVLLWDMCIITLYLAINILDLAWMQKGEEEKVRKLSYLALPVAILVHSVTAWIFGLQIAKEWYTAIMAPIFVASALDSGLAFMLLALMGLEKAGVFKTGKDLMSKLARLLAVFVCADAFFIGCELLTMAYPQADGAEALAIMATGATAPFFWFEILCGLLLPFLVLASAKRRQSYAMVAVASALVILGVLCKRVWLLFTSFVMPNVYGGAGITLGNVNAIADAGSIWTALGTYVPTAVEFVIIAGVVSVGALMFVALVKRLMGQEQKRPV